MKKEDLVKIIAEDFDIPQKMASDVIDGILGTIAKKIRGGEEIALRGFGTFNARPTQPRIARNPKTGEQIAVPAGYRIKFRPGSQMRQPK